MERVYNFNPGPAILPLEALKEAQKDLLNYKGIGMSIMEISHRSQDFKTILTETKNLFRRILEIPDNYEILFLQGGASLQFAMVPMNFLTKDKKAGYILTGSWSKKAFKEAKLFGDAYIVANTEEDKKFRRIPKQEELKIQPDSVYIHITSNNTIFGTQWKTFPDVGNIPLIADMSSDILSRKFDVNKFSLIYAGAQKNLGPAGVTIVIIKKEMLSYANENLTTMLQYKTHVENDSLYNTPPVWCIYMVKLVLEWMEREGGLEKIQQINEQKGKLLYGLMDKYPDFYRTTVDDDSRSLMNVTMRLPNEDLEKEFIDKATKAGFVGLKGHRSVGGIRVSMYNALPLEGIEKLVEFMEDFKNSH